MRISNNKMEWYSSKGVRVPHAFLEHRPFTFDPEDIKVGKSGSYLKQRILPLEKQEAGLNNWLKNPSKPIVYGVGSEPSDAAAKYFAAHLVQKYVESVHNRKVIFHHIYSGYSSPLITNEEPCTLLVLSGLSLDSTQSKIDKCVDLLEYYSNIPRIVVCSGVDPITFFSLRLKTKLHSFFHKVSSTVDREFV